MIKQRQAFFYTVLGAAIFCVCVTFIGHLFAGMANIGIQNKFKLDLYSAFYSRNAIHIDLPKKRQK